MSALDRVARWLDEEVAARRRAGVPEAPIDLAITQQDLAAWVGASREAVSKALRTLQEAGDVDTPIVA